MYDRWYSRNIRAESLFAKLRPGFDGANVSFKNVRAWVASVMGIILTIFLLIALLISLGENERKNENNNVTRLLLFAGMGVGFAAFGGAITWSIVGAGNRRLKNRLFAFDDATKKYDIKSCGNVSIREDYGLPLFHSIELDGCPAKSLSAWMCGKWKDDEFAWLQGGQLVDPLMRTVGDNAAFNVATRVLFGAKGSRVNRLKQAGFEAVVFSEELNLPDIVLGHHKIIETSYTKKALKGVSQPLPGKPVTSVMTFGAVSDPRGGAGVYGALADIVSSRQCLIQVLGGRVVVFLNSFIGWNSNLVESLEDIERELDLAHTVFQRLKIVAESKDRTKSAPVDTNTVAEAFKPQNTKRVSVGNIVAGVCLLLFGGLGVLGGIGGQAVINQKQKNLPREVKIADTVEAKISNGGLKRSTNSNGETTAQPWVEYKYRMYGQSYKRKSVLSADKAFIPIEEAKTLLGEYHKGMKVDAWFNPESPGISSLTEKIVQEPQVAEVDNKPVDLTGAIAFSALLAMGGLGLIIFGFIGNPKKAIIPDFTNSGSGSVSTRETTAATMAQTMQPATDAEPEWSNLSSAKYFKEKPAGMLD